MLAANNSPYKNYYNPEPKEPEFGGLVKAIALAVFLILFILSFYGCNPVQKVLTDPAKFEQVGQKWAALNPCVNDTVVNLEYIKGDTIVTNYTDTLYCLDFFRDTIYKTKTIYNTKTLKYIDTIRQTKVVIDKRFESQLTASKSKVEQLPAEIKKREKGLLFSALWVFILQKRNLMQTN